MYLLIYFFIYSFLVSKPYFLFNTLSEVLSINDVSLCLWSSSGWE